MHDPIAAATVSAHASQGRISRGKSARSGITRQTKFYDLCSVRGNSGIHHIALMNLFGYEQCNGRILHCLPLPWSAQMGHARGAWQPFERSSP